ncbi:MAG: hydroxymethylbilane synthase [Candidatus Omnitrophica bacterium]|nr:hydroxymethylbilane synthase [Candidatus Omnitrophota bacterium]
MKNGIITVGTRKSALALTQTNGVIAALKQTFPEYEFIVKPISTAGDRVPERSTLPEHQGIFVKEIEEALLNADIDMAVHSLKDMPCTMRPGLELGAVCARENPQDALLSRGHIRFYDLKAGARIGTSSIRRRAQILAARQDIEVVPLRGNIDTRIRKLLSGEVDAIVIAAAGVLRLAQGGLITEYLPLDILLPAPCQGALAIEIRRNDPKLKLVVQTIDHAPTRCAVTAERSFLKGLGGGCSLPVGALAEVTGEALMLTAQVVSPDGKDKVQRSLKGLSHDAEALGEKLALEMLDAPGGWIRAALKVL